MTYCNAVIESRICSTRALLSPSFLPESHSAKAASIAGGPRRTTPPISYIDTPLPPKVSTLSFYP